MSRRKKYYRSKEADFATIAITLLLVGITGAIIKYKEQVLFYGYIVLGIIIIVGPIVWFYWRKRKKVKMINYETDNRIIYTWVGMPPDKFEMEMTDMFSRLGYDTEHVGKSHDGGIDIKAKKDGDKYLIQCKKYITNGAGVQEVREFNGVVASHLAKKGFFISTNGFTLEAEKEFKNNPRIELIDQFKLLKYYKTSLK